MNDDIDQAIRFALVGLIYVVPFCFVGMVALTAWRDYNEK